MRASDVAIPARLTNEATGIVVPIDPSVFATEIERLALETMRVSLLGSSLTPSEPWSLWSILT